MCSEDQMPVSVHQSTTDPLINCSWLPTTIQGSLCTVLPVGKIRPVELRVLAIRSLSYKKDKALVFSQGGKDLNLIWNVSVSKRIKRNLSPR